MAVSAITTNMMAGVNYTATTDSSTDWSAVTDNTYFYDKTNKIVYYKNNSGIVVNAYDTFTGGTVSGNTLFTQGVTASTISATTYQNLPSDITVTGGTYSAGTITFTNTSGGTFIVTGLTTGSTSTISGDYLPLSGGTVSGNTIFTSGLTASTTTINGNLTVTGSSSLQTLTATTTNINGNLTVTGNTNVSAFTGTTGYISGSGQSILTVIGSGNSTTSPLFSVQGSSGELFSVTDSLTGSLFSVNDISGLPIMEVFSDNTTLWGSYQSPSLNTTVKISAGTGSTTVYTIPQSAYTGAFFEYTVSSTSGARAGNVMSIFSGSSVQYTETTTNDIGTTTGLTFSVSANSTNAVLLASGATAGWTIKTIVRSI